MTRYRELLIPELGTELSSTRKILNRVPNGNNDFRPHKKSYTLSELAGHVAEMPMYLQLALTNPDVDLAKSGYVPFVMKSKEQALAVFDELAAKLHAFFLGTPDATFEEQCQLLWEDNVVFTGTRYDAYRSLGLNHLLHHRAQLGVYLRLLDLPVPAMPYGPSADEA